MSITAQNISSDSRLVSLVRWLETLHGFSLDTETVRPASSDASFRRYFRVNAGNASYIVMDAPPEKENIEPFIRGRDGI